MNPRIDQQLFDQLKVQAEASPRRRAHLNLHERFDEPVQRVCIGLAKGTYVRPHAHLQDHKWELILGLQGRTCLIIFEPTGPIRERLQLAPGDSLSGIELAAGTWHTLYPLDEPSVIMEVKQGPYEPATAARFAAWAPAESDIESADFLRWLEQADIGDSFA